jgi:hypothetical protein
VEKSEFIHDPIVSRVKLLYVFLGGSMAETSISKKIEITIRAMNNHGFETQGVFVHNKNDNSSHPDNGITYLKSELTESKRFRKDGQKESDWMAFVSYVTPMIETMDYIYLRYPLSHPCMIPFLKRYGNKVVIEHNTNELGELKMLEPLHPFGLSFSQMVDWFSFQRLIQRETSVAPKILSMIRLGLANTPETVRYQKNRTKDYPCKLLTNGIDFSKKSSRKYDSAIDKTLTAVVMRGSAQMGIYDGLDRLILGLKNYDGDIRIRVVLIGKSFKEDLELATLHGVSDAFHHLGELHGEELEFELKKCHLGIGTLALHRKGMSEASVLRVNHYLSIGLPVMVGYRDVELMNEPKLASFFHQIEANDDPLDVNSMLNFAQALYENQSVHKEIFTLAKKSLSFENRMEQLKSYLNIDS